MSETKTYQLDVQPDFVKKQSSAKPLPALCEFIWNALDADAINVNISIVPNGIGIQKIIIQDNGHGISHADATEQFKRLGGSWKKPGALTKTKNRPLHGREGKGRFHGFALGNVINWNIIGYNKTTEKLEEFDISILKSDIKKVTISSPRTPSNQNTGVTAKITDFDRDYIELKKPTATQKMSEMLALYLTNYSNITINYDGEEIDPSQAIKNTQKFNIDPIHFEEKKFDVNFEIIEWDGQTDKTLYLCNLYGFPFLELSSRFQIGNFKFSGYLKSDFIEKLHNERRLELVDMMPVLSDKIEQAKNLIKEHFQKRAAEEAKTLVEQWKEEKVYPYKTPPKTNIQIAGRYIFDNLAVNVNNALPDFKTAPKAQKALQLRLLRHAIEKNPSDIQIILNEVLDLPKRKQAEFAALLKETSLSSIISASKMITDRLRFITVLEELIFNPDIKKNLKERSQLHKILEDHTWIFGEEFHLSASDKGLTEVLRRHCKAVKDDDFVVDEPVKRVDGTRGIVDLMLTRIIKTTRAEEPEHLVIELKAPSVKIGQKEINQIEQYALAVAKDQRFNRVGVRWDFWLISNEMDELAQERADGGDDTPKGVISRSKDGNKTVWVKTWAEIINANKARLKFIKEKLEYQVDKDNALKHLQETYTTLIEGTKLDDAIDKTLKE